MFTVKGSMKEIKEAVKLQVVSRSRICQILFLRDVHPLLEGPLCRSHTVHAQMNMEYEKPSDLNANPIFVHISY